MQEAAVAEDHSRERLLEVARVFLKLGVIGFGGPAAHIALMEQETVGRRGWLSREEFVDLVGAVNLIPGPNSTELAIHLGLRRAGPRGLLVAGACFIVPAALLTLACAWAYVRFGTLPAAESALYGIKPAMLAIVLAAMVRLAQAGLGRGALLALGAAATVASVLGLGELAILLAGGLAALAAFWLQSPGSVAGLLALAVNPAPVAAAGAAPPSLGGTFLFFLKIGSVLYGSGYVLIAFLRGGLVAERHWLTEQQLLDAVAVGQFTPGPVFTTATFVGYLLGGVAGAVVATLGIFLPSFVFVAATSRFIPRLRSSASFGAFLDGVNAAALGLMLAVVLQLARGALTDGPAWLIGALALAVTTLTRVNATWVILAAAALGLASQWLRG
jgi:chromate transporter